MDWKSLLLVMAGGALGAAARFATNYLPRQDFPWPTLVVNLLGSFLIGYLFLGGQSKWHPFIAAGFLGAFTTLSTYSLETVNLFQAEKYALGATNVLANALGGPLLALAGWRLSLM